METKVCSKCKNDLPIEQFSIKKGKPQSYCKSCHSEYRKNHYEQNKQKYIDKASNYRKEFWEWFRNLKKDLSCIKCGEDRHWVLDFHHRDSSLKDNEVSKLINSVSKSKVLQEIEKCDVLCANCHRDLHYQERISSNSVNG